jgi:hypothetical protein
VYRLKNIINIFCKKPVYYKKLENNSSVIKLGQINEELKLLHGRCFTGPLGKCNRFF